jgi:hypothetical protein
LKFVLELCGEVESVILISDNGHPDLGFGRGGIVLCSFECRKWLHPAALPSSGFPEVTLSLKMKPEVRVGTERLRQTERHIG